MKFSTVAVTSAVLLSANNNASMTANAFAGPSPSFTQQQQQQQQQQQTRTRLSLFPDPILATSVMESSSVVMSSGFVDGLGSLALLGSVGFGVFAGMKDPSWSYEYKVGNDYEISGGADLALLEENPTSVIEKVEEETAAKKEPEPVLEATAVVEEVVAVKKPKPVAAVKKTKPVAAVKKTKPVAAAKAKPIKANAPSKEVLESAEKAKAVVQKVGVQETKQKMNSKTGSSTPATPPVEEKTEEVITSSTEVAEPKTPGGKRRFAKGMSLILAAGAVAVARNVVRAYLGRGLL